MKAKKSKRKLTSRGTIATELTPLFDMLDRKPKNPFTDEELKQIRARASATWDYVASDAYQLEGFRGTVAEKAELVLDAGRIVQIGGLDPALYVRLGKLEWKEQVKLVRPALSD